MYCVIAGRLGTFTPNSISDVKIIGDAVKQIVSNYSFNSASGTITFTDFTRIDLNRVLLVTDVTSHTMLYQFNNPALGGTVSGKVLDLVCDTTQLSSSDELQIIYDCAAGDPQYDAVPVLRGIHQASVQALQDGAAGELQLDGNGNLKANLVVALSKDIDSILTYPRGNEYRGVTSSTLVHSGSCKLTGIWVSAASGTPTLKVWDSTAASGSSLIGTFTPVAATMYSFPTARATNGLFVTVTGTVDCTVFFDTTA